MACLRTHTAQVEALHATITSGYLQSWAVMKSPWREAVTMVVQPCPSSHPTWQAIPHRRSTERLQRGE